MNAQNKPLVSLQFRRKAPGGSWTRAHGVWEDMPEKKSWDFVGEFLPNYDHDNDVTYSNDLSCILDGTWTREKFDGYYPAHKGDSLEDLQKILEKTDAGLYERAEKYLDEAIQSGVIEVRELEVSIVSARIIEDTKVWLRDGSNGGGEEQGIWIDQMKLQKVLGRSLDDDGEQFQIFLIDEKTGKGKWMFAQNIDFE